jgi:hypothetical protein
MRFLLHTALLATIAIAAPAPHPDCGRGGYNSWDGDTGICRRAHDERDGGGISIKSSPSDTDVDINGGRKGYNGFDGDSNSKRSADVVTNGRRSGYNGWDGASSYADFGRRWHRGRDSQRGSCDLRNAVMPAGKLPIQIHTSLAQKTLTNTSPPPLSPFHPQQQASPSAMSPSAAATKTTPATSATPPPSPSPPAP